MNIFQMEKYSYNLSRTYLPRGPRLDCYRGAPQLPFVGPSTPFPQLFQFPPLRPSLFLNQKPIWEKICVYFYLLITYHIFLFCFEKIWQIIVCNFIISNILIKYIVRQDWKKKIFWKFDTNLVVPLLNENVNEFLWYLNISFVTMELFFFFFLAL